MMLSYTNLRACVHWPVWIALTVLGAIAASPADAQQPAPQACEQSRLLITAPDPSCGYREENTPSGQCVIRTYSAWFTHPDGASRNYTYRLREPTQLASCYMSSAAPQAEIEGLKWMAPNARIWSATRTLNGAAVATFTNQHGKSCMLFEKHGPALRDGVAWFINGFYCEPPASGPGPIPDARIQSYIDMASTRN